VDNLKNEAADFLSETVFRANKSIVRVAGSVIVI
jgi:hypothetical protein